MSRGAPLALAVSSLNPCVVLTIGPGRPVSAASAVLSQAAGCLGR